MQDAIARTGGELPTLQGKGKGRSMFGKQTESRKMTAPMFTFSQSCTRDQASKMFLSSAHVAVETKGRTGASVVYSVPGSLDKQMESARTSAPQYTFPQSPKFKDAENATPGPGKYDAIVHSIGDQALSNNSSPARYRFGTAEREKGTKVYLSAAHNKELLCTTAPPVGTYDAPSCFGQQSLSPKKNSPSFSLPRSSKLIADGSERLTQSLPPLGAYETWHSIGKQPLSRFKTLPAYKFGNSDWSKEEKRFLSPGHVRELRGTWSPSNFDHQKDAVLTSFGKQIDSKRSSPAVHTFSKDIKCPPVKSNVPGPGAYE